MSPVIMRDGERGHPLFEKLIRWLRRLFPRSRPSRCALCDAGRFSECPEAMKIMVMDLDK